jgi:hypothetical protein
LSVGQRLLLSLNSLAMSLIAWTSVFAFSSFAARASLLISSTRPAIGPGGSGLAVRCQRRRSRGDAVCRSSAVPAAPSCPSELTSRPGGASSSSRKIRIAYGWP